MWWRKQTPATRTQQLLEEARMAELEHREAGEHHLKLAEMYRERIKRLEGAQGVGEVGA